MPQKHQPKPLAPEDGLHAPRSGNIHVIGESTRLSHSTLRELVRKHEPATNIFGFAFRPNERLKLVLAPALDGTLHPAQAFMLGKSPYPVMRIWMPLHAIGDRMQYQLDESQFKGRKEVWLTTLQAWTRAKGDCEDHAILLADWLIDMGLDARVVLGTHRREGHAWVVVFKDGKEFLLEATLKNQPQHWSAYPLAGLMPEYHPKMMFNRYTLWVNTGSTLTVNYAGPNWQPAITFEKQ